MSIRRNEKPEAQTMCSVISKRFRCKVPAGIADVVLKDRKNSPAYFFDVNAEVDKVHDLGPVTFSAGGSLIGTVIMPDELRVDRGLQVRLTEVTGTGPTADELQSSVVEARLLGDGMFYATGLAAGHYAIDVEAPGRAAALVPRVTIVEGLEARLIQPISLAAARAATLSFDPPQDPYGKSWKVELVGPARAERGVEDDAVAGLFRAKNVSRGDIDIIVLDHRGNRFYRETVGSGTGDIEKSIEIGSVVVEGTVSRGGEPFEGIVWVGGRNGAEAIMARTDQVGEFHAIIPRAGRWRVDVQENSGVPTALADVEIHADEYGRAVVELEVPTAAIRGRVVDQKGAGVPSAAVTVLAKGRTSTVETDEQGQFRFESVSSGTVKLSGAARTGRARDLTVQIPETGVVSVELTLEPLRVFRGRVVSAQGPLPGALVAIWPEVGGTVRFALADLDGAFKTEIREGESVVHLAVGAPGHALAIRRVAVSPDPVDLILNTRGGTLTVRREVREREVVPIPSVPQLRHGQVIVGVPLLRRLIRAGAMEAEDDLALHVEPGDYAVCVVSGDGGEACANGFLALGGSLNLTVPTS